MNICSTTKSSIKGGSRPLLSHKMSWTFNSTSFGVLGHFRPWLMGFKVKNVHEMLVLGDLDFEFFQ
jgi:hypothetical protein